MGQPTPQQLRAYATQVAREAGIDPRIFSRQINQESGFQTRAVSGAGAQGIAQIMPATAKAWHVNPNDPYAALKAAAQHDAIALKQYGGDWRMTLAAYNAGGGNARRALGPHGFAETKQYVANILGGGASHQPPPSPAGVTTGPAPAMPGLGDQKRSMTIDMLFGDDPSFAGQLHQIDARRATPQPTLPSMPGTSPAPSSAGAGGPWGWAGGLHASSGDHEAAGVHAAGGYHYQHPGVQGPGGDVAGVDFGNAINKPNQLNHAATYAYQHPGQFNEFFFDKQVPGLPYVFYVKNGQIHKGAFGGHADHVHAAPVFGGH